jgi:hypothetical protein
MDIEILLWVVLPTVIALCAAVASLFVAFRTCHAFQFALSALVMAGVAWSLLTLYSIFLLSAWPTYLPHLVIGVVSVIAVAQPFVQRK